MKWSKRFWLILTLARRIIGVMVGIAGLLWIGSTMNACISNVGTPRGNLPITKLGVYDLIAFAGIFGGPILMGLGTWIVPKSKPESEVKLCAGQKSFGS